MSDTDNVVTFCWVPDGSGGGSIAAIDGVPGNMTQDYYEATCCNLDYSCESSGASTGFGESFSFTSDRKAGVCDNATMTADFTYDTASNDGCGGSNDQAQGGDCSIMLILLKRTKVTYRVHGNVETHDPGYDKALIYRDGLEMVSIESTEEDGDDDSCGMENKDDTYSETLEPGRYNFDFSCDTGDGNWHKNMKHYFSIKFKSEQDI